MSAYLVHYFSLITHKTSYSDTIPVSSIVDSEK